MRATLRERAAGSAAALSCARARAAAFPGTGLVAYASYSGGVPTYGSVVKFYYTFVGRGLNTFTSAVNFTALAAGRTTSVVIPLQTFSFVALPLAPAGALVQGTQRLSGALRTAGPAGRRLFQAASNAYAQASALAAFAPLDKSTTVAAPPPANTFGSF